MGGRSAKGVKITLSSETKKYTGTTKTYYNLLKESNDEDSGSITEDILSQLLPPPVRSLFNDYIPKRDMFTSPFVSFAYERGWRQQFAAAGFPGIEKEFDLVKDYFGPVTTSKSTVIDMSCATGLMTRKLAQSGQYSRVIGCDYSPSMLNEARRRLNADTAFESTPDIELIRCDVAKIPLQTGKIDALHAGAAFHCWPDVDAGLSEIYRVLKENGRFFATTFLASYFSNIPSSGASQVFNVFKDTEQLKDLMVKAGFDTNKLTVEVVGEACVIIRAEK